MPHHYYNHSRRDGRSLAGSYAPSGYPGIGSYVQPPPPIESGMLPALGAGPVDTALAVPAAAAEVAPKAGGCWADSAISAISRTWLIWSRSRES